MPWPVLFCLAVASLAGLHWWWRKKFHAAIQGMERERQRLSQARDQAAAQAQSQQDALLNSLVEGFLLLDASGRIQLANPAFLKLFGLADDPRGKTIIEAVRLHELVELLQSFDHQTQLVAHQLKVPGPHERWVEVNGAALFNPDGRRQGTLLVFHDLTRLKKLERTREEFVANVSHELRTPLSLIKGYAETLLDGALANPEVATKFLETIDRNTERLKLLIEDLLTISELESGRMQLNCQTIDLHTTVEKVLAELASRAAPKSVRLSNATPALQLRADPDRLEQVLFNLVDNAIKYGRAGGSVTVGASLDADQDVEVYVQDDGPGIPAEALDRIFERFFRVDKARSRDQGGTGLGLSIVKHIVQSHGGKVWARSQPSQGATFHFTLPRSRSEPAQPTLL